MQYRKKPVTISAAQWFANGDHPDDDCTLLPPVNPGDEPYKSEGKIVRYYRNPTMPGFLVCKQCSYAMHKHGWIDTREGGYTVCPGDWIITGIEQEKYPCKPSIFKATYEEV